MVDIKRMGFLLVIIAMLVTPNLYGGRLTYGNGAMDSDPITLVTIMLSTAILFGLKRETLPLAEPQQQPVGKGSRFFAAIFDLLAVMFACFAVMFPVHLIVEWILTGTWQWSWDSHRYGFMNVLGFISVFLAFWAMYQYFWLHLKNGRTTIGQYIMGYRVIALDGADLRKRLSMGLWKFIIWPMGLFSAERSPGVYSWDEESLTRAVSTKLK